MTNFDISIITRTKRRPLFLERVQKSLINSNLERAEWIVVEDDDVISDHTKNITDSFTQITGIPHNLVLGKSCGRANAANLGFQIARGKYIHIYDDDDTIANNFYHVTLKFLQKNTRYSGVGTRCYRIDEQISNGEIKIFKKNLHYPERTNLGLFEVASVFSCPPVSLVLSKDIINKIGGCNVKYHVCEDFDLILRFLLEADLGYTKETTANFHTRMSETGYFGNSNISKDFELEDMLFRNQLLREDINSNQIGLGWLLAATKSGRRSEGILHLFQQASKRLRAKFL